LADVLVSIRNFTKLRNFESWILIFLLQLLTHITGTHIRIQVCQHIS